MLSNGLHKRGNLFFSLGQLDISPGETAQFNGPPTGVQNVLVRVSGGPATIDGTLASTVGNADFYLIDPAGVVFGAGAKLSMPASFRVATADEIKLADGQKFAVSESGDTTLSTASPMAFGFLSANPAVVTVGNQADLSVVPAKTVMIAAGGITINDATVTAPGGKIALAGVSAAGDVGITDVSIPASGGPGATSGGAGMISIKGSTIIGDGSTGGQLIIRGGALLISHSYISAENTGAGNGKGINIKLNGALNITKSDMYTTDTSTGQAGDIQINAAGPATLNIVNVEAEALNRNFDGGTAGNVRLKAANVSLLAGAMIETDTIDVGNSGNITVVALGLVDIEGNDRFNGGLITNAYSVANAGNIDIRGDDLKLGGKAHLSAQSDLTGAAGDIHIMLLGNGVLDDNSIITTSRIGVSTEPTTLGAIVVEAQNLSILNGSEIESVNYQSSSPTKIRIDTSGDIRLASYGEVTTSAETAAGGEIILHAGGNIEISDHGLLSANSVSGGGNISVDATGALIFHNSKAKAVAGYFGGSLIFQSAVTVLEDSRFTASATGQGGNIQLIDGGLFEVNSHLSVSGAKTGTIEILSPDPDITGAIAALRLQGPGRIFSLIPACAQMTNSDYSSFVQAGQSGLAPEPGGFLVEEDNDARK